MSAILNITAYRFVDLTDTTGWRDRIHAEAERRALLGTMLIAEEGINLSLAGSDDAVRSFLRWLDGERPFTGLAVRESRSSRAPFSRLRVKVKPEIIRMNRPAIRPGEGRAPAIEPNRLARWLETGRDDGGRELLLLDTRNAFEVDAGRFRGAHDWRLDSFGGFPAALDARRSSLDGKTIVTYCTGGVRCEKAALLMKRSGVQDVWQLEGGILAHLAATGGRHFEGRCVVFDERGALTDTLEPAEPV